MFLRWQSRPLTRPYTAGLAARQADGSYLSYRKIVGKTKGGQDITHYRLSLDSEEWRPDVSWRAVLVESYRQDGKPRSRHVAYLIGFTETQVAAYGKDGPGWFGNWWKQIEEKLDRLASRITPEERTRIEAGIATKLPRPTAEQIAVYEEAWKGKPSLASMVTSINAAMGDTPSRLLELAEKQLSDEQLMEHIRSCIMLFDDIGLREIRDWIDEQLASAKAA
jgi:hypothetical protein